MQVLREATAPHVESFNFMLSEGLLAAVADLDPIDFDVDNKRVSIAIESCRIGKPEVAKNFGFSKKPDVWPTECRQRRVTYKGDFTILLRVRWVCLANQPCAHAAGRMRCDLSKLADVSHLLCRTLL